MKVNRIEIRPRFELEVDLPPDEVLTRIKKGLSNPDADCTGKILNPHAVLQMHDEKQHYWSPQLTVEVETKSTDNSSLLRCIMGPMPAVWTMFASFYALSVFIGLVGLVWGGSQWSLGMSPYALWLVPVSVIMISIAYVIALTGQKLGYDQMLVLKKFLVKSIDSRITRL